MKRVIGVLTVLLVLGGLAFAVLNRTKEPEDDTGEVATLTGMVGSEKGPFFGDQRVKDALKAKGLAVSAQSVGSWQMGNVGTKGMDFAFPSSQPPAEQIKKQNGLTDVPPRPFYSPLVILAHRTTANVLLGSGLAKQDEASKVWTFAMDTFLADVASKKRWEDLAPTDRPGELSGELFLTTTNPDTSSSGALYVAMLAYLLNQHQSVTDRATVDKIAPALREAVNRQGQKKNSTEEVFVDFVSSTGGPLVLAYESQALDLTFRTKIPPDMVMLYPDTTIVSDHTLVGLTENGRKLGQALTDDAALRKLEVDFGFRPSGTSGTEEFAQRVKQLKDSQSEPKFAFAPELGAAKIKQATVPEPSIMKDLVDALGKNG
ncbi:substrate-binding domain-containing protein [Kitasatospora purpeofusca]|uniref:hypothetical protein n=1 Tax=Kitasatospora purpeofusca TaxID=67352 RepID=UPI00325604D7